MKRTLALVTWALLVAASGITGQEKTTPKVAAGRPAPADAANVETGSESTFAFEPKELHLPTGSTRDDLLAEVTMKTAIAAENPELSDLPSEGVPGSVEFHYVGRKQVEGSGVVLWFVASVDHFPKSLSMQRIAVLKINGKEHKLPYTLTNLSGTPQLTVQGPAAPWILKDNLGSTSVDVVSGDAAATDLRISASAITEKDGGASIDSKELRLCATSVCDGLCPAPSLGPHSRGTYLLCKVSRGSSFGEYNGKVVISAAEYPAGTSTQIKAFITSSVRRLWGLGLLFFGVVSAWFVRTYVANRLTRDQALLGVALQRQRVERLMPSVIGLATDFRLAEGDIFNYLTDLRDNKLTSAYVDAQLYVTPKIPVPFQFSPRAAQFAAFLNQVDASLNLLEVIVQKGLDVLWPVWKSSRPNNQVAFQTAVQGLDSLFVQGVAPAAAQSQVAAIMQTWRGSVAALAAAAATPGPQLLPSTSALLLDIRRLSQATWLAICFLTILAGWVVLISRNPGFGKASDLVLCVFWGFGIPVTAQSLLPNSVLNAFGGSTMKVSATV